MAGFAGKDSTTPLSIGCVPRFWIDKRFGYGQYFLRRKLVPGNPCNAIRKFHGEPFICGAHYARILPAAGIGEWTRETRTVEIVNQSVLPIEQELRSFLCDFFCRLIVRADQFHIPDPLARLSKVIQRDLLLIIGKRFVPRTAIQPARRKRRHVRPRRKKAARDEE